MYVYNLASLFSCRQWEEVRRKQEVTAWFFSPFTKQDSLPPSFLKKRYFNKPEEGLGKGRIKFGFYSWKGIGMIKKLS